MTVLINSDKRDTSERCIKLNSNSEIHQFMALRLALTAIKRKDKQLCAKIIEDTPLIRRLCERYFQAKPVKANSNEKNQMKTHKNILLHGTSSGNFADISDETNTVPGE